MPSSRNSGATLAVIAVAAAIGASAVSGAHGTVPRPSQWTKLPVTIDVTSGNWFRILGWASGRIWFGVGSQASSGTPVGTIWSARLSGSHLTSFVSSRVTDDQLGQSFLLGSRLIQSFTKDARTAALLPSGKVGPWVPIPGDPIGVAQQLLLGGEVQSGATLGARALWVVVGGAKSAAGGTSVVVCCTPSGEPTDVASALVNKLKFVPLSVRLGVDAKGRVWLAWAETVNAGLLSVHLVELDAATLAPTVTKSYGPAGNGGGGGSQASDSFTLACSDTCHLVFSSRTGILDWDGNGAPVKLVATRGVPGPGLLAAAYVGQRLEIVTTKGSGDYGWQVIASREATRAGGLAAIASAAVPRAAPHPNETYFAQALRAAPTPTGFVTLAGYPASGRQLLPLVGTVLRK